MRTRRWSDDVRPTGSVNRVCRGRWADDVRPVISVYNICIRGWPDDVRLIRSANNVRRGRRQDDVRSTRVSSTSAEDDGRTTLALPDVPITSDDYVCRLASVGPRHWQSRLWARGRPKGSAMYKAKEDGLVQACTGATGTGSAKGVGSVQGCTGATGTASANGADGGKEPRSNRARRLNRWLTVRHFYSALRACSDQLGCLMLSYELVVLPIVLAWSIQFTGFNTNLRLRLSLSVW